MADARCPKGLREIVADSTPEPKLPVLMDGEQVIEELSKLKGLANDDKTENAMLRSRIDEQCELIMILKRRADEGSDQLKTSERIRETLVEFRERAQHMIDTETKKAEMLESRFNELAENHRELITYKDQYKSENKYLKEENERLKKDNEQLFSEALNERQSMIEDLEAEVLILKERVTRSDERATESHNAMLETRRVLTERLEKTEESLQAIIDSLRRQVQETETKLKEVTYKYKSEQCVAESMQVDGNAKIDSLNKEKEDLLALVMKRGKIIEDKGVELRTMEGRLKEARKRQKDADERFEREAASVDSNIQVVKLRRELSDSHDHVAEVEKKFDAYKNHTNKLLQQERELNAKLRHLVG